MRQTLILLILIQYFSIALGQELPRSVNIVTGVPLTIPEAYLQSMGLLPHQNTGGWGDVMANVSMALDIKKQFPKILVRLIVTLNDTDPRPAVNRVRNFIPNILKNEKGEKYLNPDSLLVQHYQGLEIYFVEVPSNLSYLNEKQMSQKNKNTLKALTEHIPTAELGLQFSANNNPYSNLVLKAEKLQLSFEEYSSLRDSLAYSFFQGERAHLKLHAGPLGFGVYGFGSEHDARGSEDNKKLIKSWLTEKGVSLADYDLAFAYAGDRELIEDYVKAIEQITSESEKGKPMIIVYKGDGEISKSSGAIKIPLGVHPKELAHALIAESTISPLVTGDGSLSSALETTTAKKSFVYEGVLWKAQAMRAFLQNLFLSQSEHVEKAHSLFLATTNEVSDSGYTRSQRVSDIRTAILDPQVHLTIHKAMRIDINRLNLADNVMNLFQLVDVFSGVGNSFKRNFMYAEDYLHWLVELVKKFQVSQGLPYSYFLDQLDDQVKGKSSQLLEKWYALFTLWEFDQRVKYDLVRTVVRETAAFLKQKDTEAKYDTEIKLFQILEQMNGSRKSKTSLYQALQTDKKSYSDFGVIRQRYNSQSQKPLLLSRQKTCRSSVAK